MSERMDERLRRVRADQFSAAILETLRPYIMDDKWLDAREALRKAAYEAEVEVTTRDSRRLGAFSLEGRPTP